VTRRDSRTGIIDLIESRIAYATGDVEIPVPRENMSWTEAPSLDQKVAFIVATMSQKGYALKERHTGMLPWSVPRLIFQHSD